MKKHTLYTAAIVTMLCVGMAGCSDNKKDQADKQPATEHVAEAVTEKVQDTETDIQNAGTIDLADGIYTAEFTTDNAMFHINEAYDNKGTLTVKDGQATIHITLPSKNVLNLFPGTAEDAQKDGAVLLDPTTDTVNYEDGTVEEVYGFDVPVPVIDEEFDLALIGKKGKWYDHKVKVSDPQPQEETTQTETALTDGTYTMELDFEGGSGRASISSPAKVTVNGDSVIATVEWSSPNYDYMVVDGEKYTPVNTDGNSVFEIPVTLDTPMDVIGDTVAMSKPHEITYTLTFHSDTAQVVAE